MADTIIEKIHHHLRQNIPGAAARRALESTDKLDAFPAKTLDMLQAIMDIEDEWDGVVYISDQEAEDLRTVGDLEALVIAKIENPAEQAA